MSNDPVSLLFPTPVPSARRLVLVLAVLLATGVGLWIWIPDASFRLSAPPAVSVPAKRVAVPSAPPPPRPTSDTVADLLRVAERPAPAAPPAGERGAELLLQTGESFVRERAQGLNLTETEIKALGRSFAYHQQVRAAFEAELATITPTDDAVTITIPPYPAAGQHLRELWLADLTATLGAERSAALAERMQPLMDLHFRGFGRDNQQIVLTPGARQEHDGAQLYDVRWYRISIYPQSDPRFTASSGSGRMPLPLIEGGELTNYVKYIRELKPRN